MDIDEAKTFAAEYTIDSLCSGRDFKGLGPLASYLVIAVAQSADENAKYISKETTRTPEKFQEMKKRVTQEFVMSICCSAIVRKTPIDAARELVDKVWHAYIDWAQEAKAAIDYVTAHEASRMKMCEFPEGSELAQIAAKRK